MLGSAQNFVPVFLQYLPLERCSTPSGPQSLSMSSVFDSFPPAFRELRVALSVFTLWGRSKVLYYNTPCKSQTRSLLRAPAHLLENFTIASIAFSTFAARSGSASGASSMTAPRSRDLGGVACGT